MDRTLEKTLEKREPRAKIISNIAEAQKRLDESYGTSDTFVSDLQKKKRIETGTLVKQKSKKLIERYKTLVDAGIDIRTMVFDDLKNQPSLIGPNKFFETNKIAIDDIIHSWYLKRFEEGHVEMIPTEDIDLVNGIYYGDLKKLEILIKWYRAQMENSGGITSKLKKGMKPVVERVISKTPLPTRNYNKFKPKKVGGKRKKTKSTRKRKPTRKRKRKSTRKRKRKRKPTRKRKSTRKR